MGSKTISVQDIWTELDEALHKDRLEATQHNPQHEQISITESAAAVAEHKTAAAEALTRDKLINGVKQRMETLGWMDPKSVSERSGKIRLQQQSFRKTAPRTMKENISNATQHVVAMGWKAESESCGRYPVTRYILPDGMVFYSICKVVNLLMEQAGVSMGIGTPEVETEVVTKKRGHS
ncbi:hypothetical protein QJS10_CPA07g01122 [Acorus calamus]|uniref:DUF7028 domain-containing protein n=1 Tax=Acorus calamus TaxID=4465 RepID=A0AAV9EDS4_ACOCL|nr:hypothetical protein QJS10_CPA07g01122 [Acorus calamus]